MTLKKIKVIVSVRCNNDKVINNYELAIKSSYTEWYENEWMIWHKNLAHFFSVGELKVYETHWILPKIFY